MNKKKCKGCMEIMPLDNYGRNSYAKDGHEGKCRQCRKEQRMNNNKKSCKHCGEYFRSQRKDAKFCSPKCSGDSRSARVVKSCSFCGKDTHIKECLANSKGSKYCGKDCYYEHLRILIKGENNPNYNRIDYTCDGCGNVFKAIPSLAKNDRLLFCEYDCYKKNVGSYFKGENNPNWNRDLTEEDRLETRRYPGYYEWRTNVYKRDYYTCQSCGDGTGGNLIAHHIYNYSRYIDIRTVLTNGITLCENCHIEFHVKYGYKNNNHIQLDEFITSHGGRFNFDENLLDMVIPSQDGR